MAKGLNARTPIEWLSSLPACILLLSVVIFSTSSDIHNKMLQIGQASWPGYYELRTDPTAPECDPDFNIDKEVDRRIAEEAAKPVDEDVLDLLADDPLDPEMLRAALRNSKEECVEQFARFEELKERVTPALKAYRSVELFVADLIAFGLTSQRFTLALLVALCATTATFTRHHIAMRAMETQLDHTLSHFLQFIANCMLFVSAWSFRDLSHAEGGIVPLDKEILHDTWIAGFGLITLVSGIQMFRVPADAPAGGNIGKALLAVPLYTTMCLISGTYFMMGGHVAGIGIYLDKMMDLSDMFLNVGLFVWAGMMLKHTRLAKLVFDLFRPWKMPPELLAFVAVLVAAIPTAYTGASGIFVIAAGAVIYSELRSAGARRHLALAASAMSGSMGVVLRPCLLVVVIAYLNREVTTDDLFGWGLYVFILTAFLFFAVAMTVNRQSKIQLAPLADALPGTLQAIKPLIPYVAVIAVILLAYYYGLGVTMDEFSAARILPVIMIGILVYEHFRHRNERDEQGEKSHQGLERSVRFSINETTAEIGALLFLFGLSVSIGGVIERAGLMESFPESFSSQWTAMLLFVCILVVLGMIMDAFGAVILVSATIAAVAYESGIHPIHFWMVTLVAFELGYLSPPVALNHLLTRQVVGEREYELAAQEEGTFYQRHERVLMPLLVMSIALVLVAFVPLMVGY
ncbi:MAG: TRAP transporter large permease subunit [Pseudomonadales bacterium]|nr:TRAP transporter large permease subunit [Pseudomonadales bacterium]